MKSSLQVPRIVVCGAVDDGKSTLIGRLLAETGSIPQDELLSVQDSTGTHDYSRLTDGLESEREQGITIDVAYRYLALPDRNRALLADSPGHEQYTRNMAVAASTATTALIVVDAIRGIRKQTLRHAAVCKLMGVTSFVIAINKIDGLSDNPASDAKVSEIITVMTSRLRPERRGSFANDSALSLEFVAVSGLRGDNVSTSSTHTFTSPGLSEGTLLSALVKSTRSTILQHTLPRDLRLPIQCVIRNGEDRWYAGNLTAGTLRVGDEVSIWPSGDNVEISELRINGVRDHSAQAGSSVAVKLSRESDLGRGDIIMPLGEIATAPASRAHLADLVWLDDVALDSTSSYVLRVGPIEIPVRCDHVRFVIDLDTDGELPRATLGVNEIGRVEITADRPFFLDGYEFSRATGGFILCDRLTGRTVAAGMSIHPLTRESEVTRHKFSVTRELREKVNGVKAGVLWLTGLPGSGKSSIADEVERILYLKGVRCYILDGDMVRQTLCEDLGFSPEDRAENVRRVSRTAQLMMDAGLIVLVSLVSPFSKDRDAARELFAHTDFAEVFVDTPLSICQQRDPKGLYAKSNTESSNQMTGLGQNYEPPLSAEIVLDGTKPIDETAGDIVRWIMARRLSE